MTSRREALKERMKEQRLNQTSSTLRQDSKDSEKDEGSEETLDPTTTMQIDNETEDAERLARTLRSKRKKTQSELMKETESGEDITEMMKIAQQRAGEKVKDEMVDNLSTTTPEMTPRSDQARLGLDETSAPGTARSATPRSSLTPRISGLNTTLRAKLLENLRAAKDKGKDEAYKDKTHKLAGERTKLKSTRFDDTEQILEDEEVVDQLEQSVKLKMRDKFKQLTEVALKETKEEVLTEQQQLDFFFGVFESEEDKESKSKEEDKKPAEDQPTPAGQPAKPEGSAPEEEEEQTAKKAKFEDQEPLLKDVDGEDFSWMAYQVGRADYMPFQDRLKIEDEIYFYPSMIEAPIQRKIFNADAQIRNIEEEGFYVGIRPFVSPRNLNRMENRLLQEIRVGKDEEECIVLADSKLNNARYWFGEDGRLITLPDPVKEVSSRPIIMEQLEQQLFVTEYRKAKLQESNIMDMSGRFQLDVDINTVIFRHHHMFSKEHVLAAQLGQQFEEYVSRTKRQVTEYLTGKLQALKSAQIHVQENIQCLEGEEGKEFAIGDQRRRLKDYKDEIRVTRKQRDFEMHCDRLLMKTMIQTWKAIKNLRQTQQCTNTSVKLAIIKEEVDKAVDEREWEEDIVDEIIEIQEDNEDKFCRDMEEYQRQLNLWKEQKLKKKEAKKRKAARDKKKKKKDEDCDDEETEELITQDDEILDEPALEKPVKPERLSDAEARQTIEARFNEIRRKPGEQKLYVELTNTATITNTPDCPKDEQTRRNDINKYKIFIKVLFNDKEVSTTPTKPLGQEFVVRFAQILNIEITHWPESITFQIYESTSLSTTLLSTVYAVIPESNITAENRHLTEYDFSSDHRCTHASAGIGSGVPFYLSSQQGSVVVNLMTTGTLSASVVWSVDEDGKILVPQTVGSKNPIYRTSKGMDVIGAIGMAGLDDMGKLSKWIEESRLDPNDPSNADIMHLMRPVGDIGVLTSAYVMPHHFRLEHVQEEFNFATDDDITGSRRFRMIQLREDEVPGFKCQRVPAFDREIPEALFADYEKKIKDEEKLRKADDTDSHRVAVAKFMQQVREQILRRFRVASHRKAYCDMVNEDAVPNIGIIIPSLLKLTEPRRPLKPVRKPRKKVTSQNLQANDVRILVNIVRAFVVPIRVMPDALMQTMASTRRPLTGTDTLSNPQNKTAQGRGGSPEETLEAYQEELLKHDRLQSSAIWNELYKHRVPRVCAEIEFDRLEMQFGIIDKRVQVRPFIEVMFQQRVLATSVADGPNPSWNEELAVVFRPPRDDFSPTNLQSMNDLLYLNLFDEFIVDVTQDDRERSTTVHQRIERRWLGSLKIPFSTIYSNGRIDGTFRIDKPAVLLGYTYENRSSPFDAAGEMSVVTEEHTFLTMFVTTEPQLSLPDQIKEKFESMECDDLLQSADMWLFELERKFPSRVFTGTVINLEGISMIATRYIKPLNPPPEILSEGDKAQIQNLESVARYVSLIPSVSDSVIFPGLCDIWSTSAQFLQMLQGDEEEHAVLLTNYFLHLGKIAWLVIGTAIPEGPTAYVLTRETGDYWLWRAGTGEHYSTIDNYCPLQSVGCLINSDNIWGNIQRYDKPSQMSFDINNTAHWKPLFHKGNPYPSLGSIQTDCLVYSPPNLANVQALQEKIESELKKKISEWRKRHVTRWNRYCIQTFRRLLIQLEEERGKGLQNAHISELENTVGAYRICGFPLNLTYTEMKPIIDLVFSTGVHEYDSSDVEFALAVHIQPYPNSVLSVWIYVASLVKKRS